MGLEYSQKLSNSFWNREYDGRQILIYFRGLYGEIPLMTADSTNLAGGISGKRPTVTITKKRTGSFNKLLFEPVSNEFLQLPADKP